MRNLKNTIFSILCLSVCLGAAPCNTPPSAQHQKGALLHTGYKAGHLDDNSHPDDKDQSPSHGAHGKGKDSAEQHTGGGKPKPDLPHPLPLPKICLDMYPSDPTHRNIDPLIDFIIKTFSKENSAELRLYAEKGCKKGDILFFLIRHEDRAQPEAWLQNLRRTKRELYFASTAIIAFQPNNALSFSIEPFAIEEFVKEGSIDAVVELTTSIPLRNSPVSLLNVSIRKKSDGFAAKVNNPSKLIESIISSPK